LPDLLYDWDETFDSPLQKTQAEVLFLLVGGLRKFWLELYATTRFSRGTWVAYVKDIVEDFCKEINGVEGVSGVSCRSDATDLWSRFQRAGLVKRAPSEVRSVFDQVRGEIEKRLREDTDPLLYLVESNTKACAAVSELLRNLGIKDLTVPEARLLIVRAEEDMPPLASTYCGKGPIHWTFQHQPRTFWAALAAQSVLEHEYLSHLVPRSQSLSQMVRENWLVAVLVLDVLRRSRADHGLLYHLLNNLHELQGSWLSSLPDVAEVMMSTQSYRRAYVGFNRELLTRPIDPGLAERVDRILIALDETRLEDREQLFTSWDGSIAGFPGGGVR
jgi:hypothetical protein